MATIVPRRDPAALDLWERYWTIAGDAGRVRGLRFRLREDLEALAAVHRRNSDSCPGFLPIFDPACNDFAPGAAIWFDAIDAQGETAATCAARLFDWRGTTLGEETRSLRAFYADPLPRSLASDVFDLSAIAPSAALGGLVGYFGAVWVRPDRRLLGIVPVMAQLSKGYAVTHWPISSGWALVRTSQVAQGFARAFGDVAIDEGRQLRLGPVSFDFCIAWQRRGRLVSELAAAAQAERRPALA